MSAAAAVPARVIPGAAAAAAVSSDVLNIHHLRSVDNSRMSSAAAATADALGRLSTVAVAQVAPAAAVAIIGGHRQLLSRGMSKLVTADGAEALVVVVTAVVTRGGLQCCGGWGSISRKQLELFIGVDGLTESV